MKKHVFSALFAGVILVGCNAAKNANSNDLATTSPIEAHIDLTAVIEDKVPVVINPGRFIEKTVTYRLPRVVQGTYSVSDFGKQ